MERTIFVTMYVEERRRYMEVLKDVRRLFLEHESSSFGWFCLLFACNYIHMRNLNQECPVCRGDLVSVILPCNHAYCFSCLYYLHQIEPFTNYPVCPSCLMIEYRDFILPSNKMLTVFNRIDKLFIYVVINTPNYHSLR